MKDRVATITLFRPDQMNGWTSEMEREYISCLVAADGDPEVAVIVLTGAGRAFCAGGDVDFLNSPVTDTYDSAPLPLADRQDFGGTFSFALGLAKPLIAAVNGPAAGRGFVLACFADIRFAATNAKFTTSFARLGLPAEDGVTWVLPRIIGASRAADLLYSSRVVLADEAERLGLVNRVYPPDELMPATLDYARAMAQSCAPSALRALKGQLWADLLDPLGVAWQRDVERSVQALQKPDFAEGIRAFTEKRVPNFPGVSRVHTSRSPDAARVDREPTGPDRSIPS